MAWGVLSEFDGGPTIETVIAMLGTLGVSDLPTAIYLPRAQAFVWLPNGVDDLDARFEERLELGSAEPLPTRRSKLSWTASTWSLANSYCRRPDLG